MGIGVLGPLTVDGSATGIGPRDRVVLSALALHPGDVVSAERLADALWGEHPPASGGKIVQGCIVRLRRRLGATTIETTTQGYRLVMSGGDVDAQQFERLLRRARELLTLGEPEHAAFVADEALALWRGRALVDLEDWAEGRVEAGRLEQMRLDAEELRIDATLRAGRYREVLSEAQALVTRAPLRERRWALLALAEYQAGRQAESLRTLRQARIMLAHELGLDPGPDLVALEQAILRQDPSLLAEALPEPSAICPYQGLLPYGINDADIFFGRDEDASACLRRLAAAGSLTVAGPSGSGKSSLVRAGVAAALQRDGRRVVVVTPGPRPLEALTAVGTDGVAPVLVVDQCEEAITLCESEDERARFFGALAAYTSCAPVVIAVRADHLGAFSEYPEFAQVVERSLYLLRPLGEEDLRAAIEGPARQHGLLLEPGLVDLLIREAEGEPGALPLLSHALSQTWARREGRTLTVAGYRETGGIRGAVAQSAEQVYEQVAPVQRAMLRDLLLRLVTPTPEGEPVRTRVPLRMVAASADHERLIGLLVDARLVTSDEGALELSHEALTRAWPRLQTWLDDDVQGQRILRHLSLAADTWDTMDRPDSELYRGTRLAQALQWQQTNNPDLNTTERDFLAASRRLAEAEQQNAEERARHQVRVNRRLRGLLAGVGALLMCALIAGLLAVREADRADVRALQAAALSEDRWDRALLYAAQAQGFDNSADSRAALLQTVQRGPEVTAMFTAGHALHSLVLSADGRKLVAGGSNGAVFVIDTESRQVEQIPDVTAFEADLIDISPDGRYVAAVTAPLSTLKEGILDWKLAVVDLEQTPLEVRYIEHGTRGGPRFTADSRTIIDVHGTGEVHYVDVVTGEVQQTRFLESFAGDDDFISVSGPEDRRTVVAEVIEDPESGSAVAFDVGTGQEVWSAAGDDPLVAAISPSGSQIISALADGRIERIDVQTGASTPVPATLAEGLIDVTWSPNGTSFAGATQDRTVVVWDATSLKVDVVLRGHWGKLSHLAYSPDGTTLYAAGLDQSVLAWDLTGNTGAVRDLEGTAPAARVFTAAMAADGSAMAVGYQDDKGARVEVTELPSGRKFEIAVPVWPLNEWELVADRSGESFLLFLRERGYPGSRRMWAHTIDVQRGELLPNPVELFYGVGGYAVVTWDNEAILAAGQSLLGVRQVGLWDLETGQRLAPALYEPANEVVWLGVHPDGRQAVLSEAGLIEVIDLRTGQLIRTLNHANELDEPLALSVVFSPDGRWLASATRSGRVVIWDARTWHQQTTWEAVPGFGVDSMVFTPDSNFLITGGAGQAAIWDIEQGGASGGVRLDVDPSRPDARVLVGVRDDGRTLVTYTDGTGVRQWDVSSDALLERACRLVGRNLTQAEWAEVLPGRSYERTCSQHPTG